MGFVAVFAGAAVISNQAERMGDNALALACVALVVGAICISVSVVLSALMQIESHILNAVHTHVIEDEKIAQEIYHTGVKEGVRQDELKHRRHI